MVRCTNNICYTRALTFEEAQAEVAEFDNTYLYKDEGDMLQAFLDVIEDADILSGWNSEGYDIPYTVNRVSRVLSKDDTRRFCLWKQLPKRREFEKFGKTAKHLTLLAESYGLSNQFIYMKNAYIGWMH